MKKAIITFLACAFPFVARANYLDDAAAAWSTMLPVPAAQQPFATRLAAAANPTSFMDMVSVLAYNPSALTIYEAQTHLDNSMSILHDAPRPKDDYFKLSGKFLGGWSSFDSKENGNFRTDRLGGAADISMRIKQESAFVFGGAWTTSKINESTLQNRAQSASAAIGAKFGFNNGFFNIGAAAGFTNWSLDKNIAGLEDSSDYRSFFYSERISTGYAFRPTQATFIVPEVGAEYFNLNTDSQTDTALQNFNRWTYRAASITGDLKIGTQFDVADLLVQPEFKLGGSYDVYQGGSSDIGVVLINGAAYAIPTERPGRLGFNSSAGIFVGTSSFLVGAEYGIIARDGFTAHTISGKIRLAF